MIGCFWTSVGQVMLPLASVVVAVAVAFIGHQQYRLAREKFKLDMFEKRFAVYKATQRFLTVLLVKAKIETDNLLEFRRDTQDATFLFGQEIPGYLKKIDGQALQFMATTNQLSGLPVGEERTKLCGKERELIEALTEELPRLQDVFGEYLKFKKWK